MTNDIVERLRMIIHGSDYEAARMKNPDGPEAADYIEALEAEVARRPSEKDAATHQVGVAGEHYVVWEYHDIQVDSATTAEYRADRLEKALRKLLAVVESSGASYEEGFGWEEAIADTHAALGGASETKNPAGR